MIVHKYKYGNAIVKVYRPEHEEERKKNEKQILLSLQQFGKAMADAERN